MTILDTFFIDFHTRNTAEAENDVKKIDKQIGDLAAKGNKRNKEEQEQLKLLRKQRIEATQDLKDQTRATDSLGDSFGGLATKIIGVGAALFGLQTLKSGVLGAVDRNISAVNQAKVSGQNPNDLRSISALVQAEGGGAQEGESLIDSMRRAATARGIAFTNPIGLLLQANKDVQGKSTTESARILEQLYGVNSNAIEAALERPVEEFRKNLAESGKISFLSPEDDAAAKELGRDLTTIDIAWTKFYTKLGTATFPALEVLLDYVNHLLDGFEALLKIPGGIGNFIKGSTAGGSHSAFGSNRGGVNPPISYPEPQSQSQGVGNATAPKTGNDAVDFWLSQGYTVNGAIGMAANEQAESSGNPHPKLTPDKKGEFHYGLYQFSEKRRADAMAALNIDVATASADDQRKAAAWDAHRRGDDVRINQGTSPEGSALIGNSDFEVSGDVSGNRARIAHQIAMQVAPILQNSDNNQNSGAGTGLNVKIDNVTVNTQATDPQGVAKAFAQGLEPHLTDLRYQNTDGQYM